MTNAPVFLGKIHVRITRSRLVFARSAATIAAMLSHRPYMRGDYQREKTSALTWLLSAIIAGFVLQLVMGASWFSGAGDRLDNLFGLTVPAIQHGWIWTLVSHSFLHSTGFIFHVLVNCVALYFLGRELIPVLGARRFFGVYAVATVIGGLAWIAVHWRLGTGEHIGATAAVDALFIIYACFFPNRAMNFLLLFIVPVTIRPKHVAYALVLVDLFALFLYEIPGAQLPFELAISSSAHLGGILTGVLYYRFVHHASWFNPQDRAEIELPRWVRRAQKVPPPASELDSVALPPPGSSREDLRAELDRILDKINSHGLSSLTPQEKRRLDEAKNLLSPP